MGLAPSSCETTFETGLKYDEKILTWKIKSFREIFENESLINAQQIDFNAGSGVGRFSNWRLFLRCGIAPTKDETKWVGIFFKIKDTVHNELFTKCAITIVNEKGDAEWAKSTTIMDMCQARCRPGVGFLKMIKRESNLSFLVDDTLFLRIKFTIYALSPQIQYLTRTQEQNSGDEDKSDEPATKKLKTGE